ncbi:hypothetical protein B9G55_21455 [Saccharibacillus sp. O16]|nr:hypothetical protein B9G55_21455 [Saccharibacillus sp. O16]
MPDPLVWKQRIEALRAFNYSETMQAGVLRGRLLHSSYSLTESRIILEIYRQSRLTATDLSRNMGLDPGYLSRLLSRLESGGVIERPRSESDGRSRVLQLTPHGERIAELLNRRVNDDVAEYLAGFSDSDQARLMDAIRTIEEINDSRAHHAPTGRYFLREAESSDAERIVRSYEALFEQTFGPMEPGFSQALADTAANLFDPPHHTLARCWIAEMNGECAGSLIAEPLEGSRLHIKLFMVESKRRGLGIGGSLLDEAIHYARENRFVEVLIWSIRNQRRLQNLMTSRDFKLLDRPTVEYYGMKFEVECWSLPLSS